MSTVTAPDLKKEQEWCIAIRVILKKSSSGKLGDGGSKKLKDNDSAAREKLRELKTKDPAKFAIFEKRYSSLAKQALTLPKVNKESGHLVAKELELLKLQMEHQLALAKPNNAKAVKEAGEKVDKASAKLSEKFESLLKGAAGAVEELEVRVYAAKSDSFSKLKTMHDTWKKAFAERNSSKDKVFDYAGSITALADWPALKTAAGSEIDKDESNQKKQAGGKGKYESKVQRLNRTLKSLKGRLGVEEQATKIRKALEKAARTIEFNSGDHVQEPKYYDGFQVLKKMAGSADKLKKTAHKKESKVLESLESDKDVRAARTMAETALANLVVKGSELISRDSHGEHQESIQELLVRCVSAQKESPRAVGEVVKELDKLTANLEKIAEDRKILRQNCNDLVERFKTGRDALAYQPSPEERELLNDWAGTFRECQTSMAHCDFESAEEDLTELADDAEKALAKSENTAAQWEIKWKSALKSAKEFDVSSLSERNKELAAKAIKQAQNEAGAGMFPAAIETLKANFGYLKTNGVREAFQGSEDCLKAKQKIALLLSDCDESLQKLVKKLQESGANNSAVNEQNDRLDAARKAWSGQLKNASSAESLDADNFAKRCIQLKTEYDKLASNPKGLRGAVKRGEYKQDLKLFNVASDLAEKELEGLAAVDRGVVYQDLAREHEQIGDSAKSNGYRESTVAMNSLKDAVAKAKLETAKRHETALATFNRKRSAVATELKALKEEAAKTLARGKKDTFKPYFEEIETDLETLGDIAKSPSVTMLQQGGAECDDLLKQLAQIRKDLAQPSGDLDELVANALGKNDEDIDPEDMGLANLFDEDPQGDPILSDKVAPTFQLVMAAVRSLQTELDDDDNLGKCKPTQRTQLLDDLKKLTKKVRSLEPKNAMKELMAFQKVLTDAIEDAAEAAEDRKAFGLLKSAFSTAYEKQVGVKPDARITLLGDDRQCFAEMSKEFSSAKGLAGSEGKEKEAILKITQLQEKISRVAGSPGEMQKEESEAQARKLKAATEKKKFEGLAEAYEKVNLPQVKKALDIDGGDKTQYDDCANLLKKARDHYKKTGDYTAAETYLGLAHDRASAAIEFPLGTAATARNALHKSTARWHKAVLSFNKSIDALLKKVKDAVKESEKIDIDEATLEGDEAIDDPNDLAKAVKQAARALARLKKLFDPTVFDDAVAVMSAKKPDPREVREAREEGLKEVRRGMKVIMKDPLIIKLTAKPHPFGRLDSSSLYTSLRDLDLNLQRSI